jgi:hypothetical protein
MYNIPLLKCKIYYVKCYCCKFRKRICRWGRKASEEMCIVTTKTCLIASTLKNFLLSPSIRCVCSHTKKAWAGRQVAVNGHRPPRKHKTILLALKICVTWTKIRITLFLMLNWFIFRCNFEEKRMRMRNNSIESNRLSMEIGLRC